MDNLKRKTVCCKIVFLAINIESQDNNSELSYSCPVMTECFQVSGCKSVILPLSVYVYTNTKQPRLTITLLHYYTITLLIFFTACNLAFPGSFPSKTWTWAHPSSSGCWPASCWRSPKKGWWFFVASQNRLWAYLIQGCPFISYYCYFTDDSYLLSLRHHSGALFTLVASCCLPRLKAPPPR